MKGDLARARELFEQQKGLAGTSRNDYAAAMAHHGLLAVETKERKWNAATRNGWQALKLYPNSSDRLIVLSDLASVFAECGRLQAAEDAFAIVVEETDEAYVRSLALCGLVWVSALRGDAVTFRQRIETSDTEDWPLMPPAIRAEIEYFRGLSFEALGLFAEAKLWFERARLTGESHGLQQIAQQATSKLENGERESMGRTRGGLLPEERDDPEVADILRELGDLRTAHRSDVNSLDEGTAGQNVGESC